MNVKLPSPEEYRKFLDGIELELIYLKDLKAKIDRESYLKASKNSLIEKIEISMNAKYKNSKGQFKIENDLKIVIKFKNKQALKIETVFVLIFSSIIKMTDGYFEIYKDTSLPLNVWPFFREQVFSLTSKMNIPPLTLPLVKR